MGQKTNIPVGSPLAKVVQSAGLWAANSRRNSTIGRLTGPMPTQASAESTIRKQTSTNYPIVRALDLGKKTGDEVDFDLVNPIGGKPIMGGEYAEGRGVGMSFSQDKLRVNQARFPISGGDTMTQIRSPHELRTLGRSLAQNFMDRYVDQSLLVHMAGARGSEYHIDWAVPLESDPDYKKIMVNPVRAPSKNRHFISNGSGIEAFGVTAGESNLITTDGFNVDVVDSIRTWLDSVPLPPQPVIFDNDEAAMDSPLRVLLVSPQQWSAFATSDKFRNFQASALQRGAQAKNHPIFRGGDVGLWGGVLVLKMPRPIRFKAGDTIKYCGSNTSEVESSCVVPASFGTTHAVDRAILLGGQALAEAFAKHGDSNGPFFWKEKMLDHDDKMEMLVGTIRGVSKIRFLVDQGSESHYTDYGVTVFDTAVQLPPAYQG